MRPFTGRERERERRRREVRKRKKDELSGKKDESGKHAARQGVRDGDKEEAERVGNSHGVTLREPIEKVVRRKNVRESQTDDGNKGDEEGIART